MIAALDRASFDTFIKPNRASSELFQTADGSRARTDPDWFLTFLLQRGIQLRLHSPDNVRALFHRRSGTEAVLPARRIPGRALRRAAAIAVDCFHRECFTRHPPAVGRFVRSTASDTEEKFSDFIQVLKFLEFSRDYLIREVFGAIGILTQSCPMANQNHLLAGFQRPLQLTSDTGDFCSIA